MFSEFTQSFNESDNAMLKIGRVCAVDTAHHAVRVMFDEEDNNQSAWAPVLCFNSLNNQHYHLPDLNEDVVCLCSKDLSAIFVLGSFYPLDSKDVQAPVNNQDVYMITFFDGSSFSYDRANHTFRANIGATTINIDQQSVQVTTSQSIKLTTNDATINAESVLVKANSVVVDAPNSSFSGNVSIAGNLTAGAGMRNSRSPTQARFHCPIISTQDIIAGSTSLQNHTHTEQGDGAPTSPPN